MHSTRVYSSQLRNSYGRKKPNQDAFFEGKITGGFSPVAAIFDGHGEYGGKLSNAAKDVLHTFASNEPDYDIDRLMTSLPGKLQDLARGIAEQDQKIHNLSIFGSSGCTMITVFYSTKHSPSLVIAVMGDSR